MKWWIGPNDEYQVEARMDNEGVILLDMHDGYELEAYDLLSPFWMDILARELHE